MAGHRLQALKKTNIVVFDTESLPDIEAGLGGQPYFTLDTRGRVFYFSWSLIAFLLRNSVFLTLRYLFEERDNWRLSDLPHLLRRLIYPIYVKSCVDALRPEVVITLIDNSPYFHFLVRYKGDYPCIAVQNGVRNIGSFTKMLPKRPIPGYRTELDEYFCFGPDVVQLLLSKEQRIHAPTYCGSYRLGLLGAQRIRAALATPEPYIALVSEWADESYPDKPFMRCLQILNQYTAQYCAEKKIPCVALLRANHPDEESYFTQLAQDTGAQIWIVKRDPEKKTNYEYTLRARLAVAINSTLLWERFALGKSVAFFNTTGDPLYDFPVDGPWMLRSKDYSEFRSDMDALISISKEDFSKKSESARKQTIDFDFEKPAHLLVKKRILDIL